MPGRKVRSAPPTSPANDTTECSVIDPSGCASLSDIVLTKFRLSDHACRELVALRRSRFKQIEIDRDDHEARFIRTAEHYGQQARDVLLSRSGTVSPAKTRNGTSLSDSARQMRRAIRTCLEEIERFRDIARSAIGPGLPAIAVLYLDAAAKPLRVARAELADLVRKRGSPGKPYGKALWWGATWTLGSADLNWPRPGSRQSEARRGGRSGTAPDLQVAEILHREVMRVVPAEFRCELPDQRTHAIKAREWAKLRLTPEEYDHPINEIMAEKDSET